MTPYCTACRHARTEPVEMLGQPVGSKQTCRIGKKSGYCTEYEREKI